MLNICGLVSGFLGSILLAWISHRQSRYMNMLMLAVDTTVSSMAGRGPIVVFKGTEKHAPNPGVTAFLSWVGWLLMIASFALQVAATKM